jgi:tRNA 2-thiouridine synthesizing protein B
MSVLHIINKSPFDRNSLDSCLRLAKADSPILLIEDGIYAVQKNTAAVL